MGETAIHTKVLRVLQAFTTNILIWQNLNGAKHYFSMEKDFNRWIEALQRRMEYTQTTNAIHIILH